MSLFWSGWKLFKKTWKYVIGVSILTLAIAVSGYGQIGSGPGFRTPWGIAVEADGSLVVVDAVLDAVVRVDAVVGFGTIVSDASIVSGPDFEEPFGIIAVEADDSLLVIDAEEELDVFFMTLDPGLNMISLPLMPPEPYTARTLAEQIGATIVIRFDTAKQKFIGFTLDSVGEGFPVEGGQGYIVNVADSKTTTFVGKAWTNSPEVAAPGVDVRTTAWAFVLSGEVQNAELNGNYTVVAKNLRTGAAATDLVSGDRGCFAAVWADLNRNSVVEAGDSLEITLLDAQGNLAAGPFRRNVNITNIRKAYLSLPSDRDAASSEFPQSFQPRDVDSVPARRVDGDYHSDLCSVWSSCAKTPSRVEACRFLYDASHGSVLGWTQRRW
jgi:hypothetical protein